MTVIVLVITSFFVGKVLLRPHPTDELLEAVKNVENISRSDMTLDVSFNLKNVIERFINNSSSDQDELSLKEIKQMVEMFMKSELTFRLKYALDDPEQLFKLQTAFDVCYDQEALLSLFMYLDSKHMQLGITNLYEKLFDIPFESLLGYRGDDDSMGFLEVDLIPYRDILFKNDDEVFQDFKAGIHLYETPIRAYLDEHLTYDGTTKLEVNTKNIRVKEYLLNTDVADYNTLLMAVSEIAKKDKSLEKLMKDRTEKMMVYLINSGDYEYLNLSENDAEQLLAYVQKGFSFFWITALNQLERLTDQESLTVFNEFAEKISLTFAIDKEHVFRGFSYAYVDGDDFIKMNHIIHGTGENVVFDHFEAVDVVEVFKASEADQAQLLKEVVLDVLNELLTSKPYKTLYDDLGIFKDRFDIEPIIDDLNQFKLKMTQASGKEVFDVIDEYIKSKLYMILRMLM